MSLNPARRISLTPLMMAAQTTPSPPTSQPSSSNTLLAIPRPGGLVLRRRGGRGGRGRGGRGGRRCSIRFWVVSVRCHRSLGILQQPLEVTCHWQHSWGPCTRRKKEGDSALEAMEAVEPIPVLPPRNKISSLASSAEGLKAMEQRLKAQRQLRWWRWCERRGGKKKEEKKKQTKNHPLSLFFLLLLLFSLLFPLFSSLSPLSFFHHPHSHPSLFIFLLSFSAWFASWKIW